VKSVHCIHFSAKFSVLIEAFLPPVLEDPFVVKHHFSCSQWCGWLSGLPHSLHSAGLASDPLRIQKDGSLWGFSLKCKAVDGAEAYTCSSESSCTDDHCGVMCCHVAGWSFFSLDVCHAVHDETSGAPTGNKQHYSIPLAGKNQATSQKAVPTVL
jgi:hypothetical protein